MDWTGLVGIALTILFGLPNALEYLKEMANRKPKTDAEASEYARNYTFADAYKDVRKQNSALGRLGRFSVTFTGFRAVLLGLWMAWSLFYAVYSVIRHR